MTVPATTARNDYVGNGSVDTYAYTFQIYDEDELEVYETDVAGAVTLLTIATDYTVTGVGEADGDVVLTSNLTNGHSLAIVRAPFFLQGVDLRRGTTLDPRVYERALDRLTHQTLALREKLDRSLRVPASEAGTVGATELPLADRADTYLHFDTNGDLELLATVPWGDVSGKPTTLAGYGITDAVDVNDGYNNPAWIESLAWAKISGKPTTLAGYGILDVDWSAINSGKPTTAAGYGITEVAWSTITGTPTTLGEFGITNGQPLDALLTSISVLPTDSTGVLVLDGGAADLYPWTAYGLSLVNAADAAAAKTLLEVTEGGGVQLDEANDWTEAQTFSGGLSIPDEQAVTINGGYVYFFQTGSATVGHWSVRRGDNTGNTFAFRSYCEDGLAPNDITKVAFAFTSVDHLEIEYEQGVTIPNGYQLDVTGNLLVGGVASVDGQLNANGLLSCRASATGGASVRLPHGSAPSSPVNGDMWTTTAGLYVRINNVTVGPLS